MSGAARELLIDLWPFVWTTLAGIVAWYIRDTNAKISRLYGAVSEAERRIDALINKTGIRLSVIETRCGYEHGASEDRRKIVDRRVAKPQEPDVHWAESSDFKPPHPP